MTDGQTRDRLPDDDWGPFGRPLFDDPSARALSPGGRGRCRLELGPDGGVRRRGAQPGLFLQRKDHVRSGQGAGRNRPAEPARAACARWPRCSALRCWPRGWSIAPLTVVATAATREADGRAGVSGRGAARDRPAPAGHRRRRRGAAFGAGRASGLARCQGHRLRHRRQLDGTGADRRRQGRHARVDPPLGPFRLQQVEGGPKARRAHIAQGRWRRCKPSWTRAGERIYLVGGAGG